MAFHILILTTLILPMTARCDGDGKVYKKDGDLIIGGLLTIHDYDEKTNTCGNLSSIWAPARAEAIEYAVSMLNNDSNILDGLTLGYEIYDTCDSVADTIRHTLNFIPGLRERDDVIGIVGPSRSAACIHTNTILSVYNVSMISHLATSDELSNGERFPYFLRTVPPDMFQVSAIADILVEYGWKYVAFLYADDSYGKNAEIEFSMQTQKKEICIGYSRRIPDSADDNFFNNIVNDLLTLKKDSLLSVVVLFILPKDVRLLFKQALAANISEDFIWIGSDGWGSIGLDPVKGLEESAIGAITISPKAEPNPDFSSFFIRTINSSRNPWIPEFVRDSKRLNEHFPPELPTPSYESTIIDSVEVLARGIDALRRNVCNKTMNISTCRTILFRNRKLLRDRLLDVTFESSSNGLVTFTENGDSQARYDIWYLNQTDKDVYRMNNVGSWWQNNVSDFQLEPFDWYLKNESTAKGFTYAPNNIPKSVCRDPCVKSIQRFIKDYCCWECEACKDNEIIKHNTCKSCFIREESKYMWPNENLTDCIYLDQVKLSHEGDKIAILVITSACIVAECIVTYLYIKNREKRLIKASSRELGYIILVGVFLCYFSAILYSTPSSSLICFLRRIVPNIGTAFIFISLATMTVRLHRIFRSGMRSTRRTKFISPKSQVLLTLVLSMIPLTWGAIWTLITPPNVDIIEPTKMRQIIETTCVVSIPHRAGQLAWDILIVLICCYFAFKTRNLPANYNQTRFIAFCVFSTLVVYIVFAPAVFTSHETNQLHLYSAIGAIIQSTVVLLLIFGARLYALYFVKEENQQLVTRSPSSQQTSRRQAHRISTVSQNTVIYGGVIRITIAQRV